MSEGLNAYFTLSTGKVVEVRDPCIEDQEKAAERAAQGGVAGDNQFLYAMATQNELVKLILVSIDGKKLSGNDKEIFKKKFTSKEYNELLLGVGELMGKPVKPQVSFQKPSGSK
jgi:hypothetical protein